MKKQVIDDNKITELINSFQVNTAQGMKPINDASRLKECVIARSIVYQFLYNHGYGYSRIARFFEGRSKGLNQRDHATVYHGLKKFQAMSEIPKQYPEFTNLKPELDPLLNSCFIDDVESKYLAMTGTERLLYKAESYDDFMFAKNFLLQSLSA